MSKYEILLLIGPVCSIVAIVFRFFYLNGIELIEAGESGNGANPMVVTNLFIWLYSGIVGGLIALVGVAHLILLSLDAF